MIISVLTNFSFFIALAIVENSWLVHSKSNDFIIITDSVTNRLILLNAINKVIKMKVITRCLEIIG